MQKRRIMRVDEQEIGIGSFPQLREAPMVVLNLRPVMGDHTFHEPKGHRDVAGGVDLPVVIKRVTDVQDPALPGAVAGVDRNSGMPAGVARQADENDAGCDPGQFLGGGEAAPG